MNVSGHGGTCLHSNRCEAKAGDLQIFRPAWATWRVPTQKKEKHNKVQENSN